MKSFFKFIGKFIAVSFIASLLWVVALRFIPIYFTPLMLKRGIESVVSGEPVNIQKKWVPLKKISSQMVYAVVASEDNKFMEHSGFSVKAIRKAMESNAKGKRLRGGSTISQQTAKNVFTFGTRTWFRKGVETYFTVLIEFIWGKERIMEVYLNITELGKGIYGVEAASRHYFNCSSKKISRQQAALLAAVLPNPRVYRVKNPGPYMRRRQSQISYLIPRMARIDFLEKN